MMRRTPLRSAHLLPLAILLGVVGLSLAGCKVTAEDIDYWTGTVKGPGKIVAVLTADKYDDALRVRAGLALVRMEPREDVDGVAELQSAIRSIPNEQTRARIVDQMVPTLLSMMRGDDTAQNEEGPPPPHVTRAKDAAFLLIPYASDEKRTELTNAVVDWFVVDFNGRNLAGNFSAEQVVRRLGAPAASRLVNALNARLPQQALVKLSELIAQLGSDETKAAAAERLVEIEREMEGDEFVDWIKERLLNQLRQSQPEATPDPARVQQAALLNRENFINEGALPAMKHLNGQTAVSNRLLQIAQTESAEAVMVTRRVKALIAMEGAVRSDQVSPLLDIALNAETPTQVRDYAFDRISDSRDASAVPRLWALFDAPGEGGDAWRVRWRVGSLILTLGGADVLAEFFNRLPADNPALAREELHGYGERISQIRPPQNEFINTQLQSTDWWDRAIALYFYEYRAERSDLSRVTALESDAAATNGPHWEDQDTVGKVAQEVRRVILERLDGGNEGGNEGGSSEGGSSEEESSEGASEGDSGGGSN